jgi:hypothetical protein
MAKIETYVVRNADGSRIGAWDARSDREAIRRAVSEFAAIVRRSQPMPKGMNSLTAKVEPPLKWGAV